MQFAIQNAYQDSTKKAYKNGERWWRLFAGGNKITNLFCYDRNTWCRFIAWRFFECGARIETIINNLSGIAYFFSRNNKNPPSWYQDRITRDVIKGLKNAQTPLEFTKPITRDILLKFSETVDRERDEWTNSTFFVMAVFAYTFALRCQDYTKGQTSPTPRWDDLEFDVQRRAITFKIRKSKNNPNGIAEEISYLCPCEDSSHKDPLCLYCIMKEYKTVVDNSGIKSPYLFLKKNRKGYQPFCEIRFREILKENLKKIVSNYSSKAWRAHGFRYGRATDMAREGVSEPIIRRTTRHAAGSRVLFRYIKMTSIQVAECIKELESIK